jgi:hypothetical protein
MQYTSEEKRRFHDEAEIAFFAVILPRLSTIHR